MENQNDISQQPSTQPTLEQALPASPKSSSHAKALLIAFALFVLIFVSLTTFILGSRTKPAFQPPPSSISPTISQPSPTPDPTANWKTYTNTKYGYSFKYPPGCGELARPPLPPGQGYGPGISFGSTDPQKKCGFWLFGPSYIQLPDNYIDSDKAAGGRLLSRTILAIDGHRTIKLTAYPYKDYPSPVVEVYIQNVLLPLDELKHIQESSGRNDIRAIDGVIRITSSPDNQILDQILSTFKFLKQNPSVTCIPRPACLDAVPRCLMPESENMCPPSPRPTSSQVVCTQDAKQCSDGSYVSRQPPTCEFAKCP